MEEGSTIMGNRLKGLDGIRGILLDIDGTLLERGRPIAGATAAVSRLFSSGLPFRVTTNITRLSRATIAGRLQAAGLPIDVDLILNPSILARRRVIESDDPHAMLLVPASARVDFEGIDETTQRAAWVVVGDIGREFTRERLDPAFRALRDGATLLALQKGRYWHDPEAGWVLDAGAFVAALEYAAGVTAELVGKPSVDFFRLALQDLGVSASETVVVGDDIEADVAGGSAAGCRTALVRTGKYSGDTAELNDCRPDHIVTSVAELF